MLLYEFFLGGMLIVAGDWWLVSGAGINGTREFLYLFNMFTDPSVRAPRGKDHQC